MAIRIRKRVICSAFAISLLIPMLTLLSNQNTLAEEVYTPITKTSSVEVTTQEQQVQKTEEDSLTVEEAVTNVNNAIDTVDSSVMKLNRIKTGIKTLGL